jgi:hypothetical protein
LQNKKYSNKKIRIKFNRNKIQRWNLKKSKNMIPNKKNINQKNENQIKKIKKSLEWNWKKHLIVID